MRLSIGILSFSHFVGVFNLRYRNRRLVRQWFALSRAQSYQITATMHPTNPPAQRETIAPSVGIQQARPPAYHQPEQWVAGIPLVTQVNPARK